MRKLALVLVLLAMTSCYMPVTIHSCDDSSPEVQKVLADKVEACVGPTANLDSSDVSDKFYRCRIQLVETNCPLVPAVREEPVGITRLCSRVQGANRAVDACNELKPSGVK